MKLTLTTLILATTLLSNIAILPVSAKQETQKIENAAKKSSWRTDFDKLILGSDNRLLWVNLAEQKLYVFQNKKLIKTYSVITGKAKTPTPTGFYTITKNRKVGNVKLTGSYGVTYVNIWNPISYDHGNLIAFHDKPAREGTGQYQLSAIEKLKIGSMGCINMQRIDATDLYNNYSNVRTSVLITKN
jgi:lipoprotein-anchoring transpeptidase ErfK/SrfK